MFFPILNIKVLEASAQLPAGIIDNGNYHAEGLFDECLSIQSMPERVRGKYCTLFFKEELIDQTEINYGDSVISSPSQLTIGSFSRTSNTIADSLNQLFGISVVDNATVKPKISGANIWTLYFNYPSMSLCLPSSCSASDVGESVANIIGPFVINNQSIVTISDESFCFSDDRDPPSFDGPDIAVM